MRNLITLFGIIALLSVGTPAIAQDDHLELAETVVNQYGGMDAVFAEIEASSPMIVGAFRANIPDLTDEEGEQIMSFFMDEMRILMPEFSADYAALFARHLTEADLRAMLDDPDTTLDGRFTEIASVLTSDANALGESYGALAMTNAMPNIQELIANR